jgi:hypothetical protein
MITHLFLPFLFFGFKVLAFDLLTLEHDSATHNVVGVVHESSCLTLVSRFEISRYNPFNWWARILFGSLLMWSSVEEG